MGVSPRRNSIKPQRACQEATPLTPNLWCEGLQFLFFRKYVRFVPILLEVICE